MVRERVQVGARVNRETYEAFKSFTQKHRGQVRGELGRLLENAMKEYMDNDRHARVEARLDEILARLDELEDSHTHTPSKSVVKVKKIAERLGELDRTVIPTDEVERAIETIAGTDGRTIAKYERQLKRRGLSYKHPSDEVWTLNRDQWVKWAVEYINNNPTVSRMDVIEDYPIGYDEIEQLATEVIEA